MEWRKLKEPKRKVLAHEDLREKGEVLVAAPVYGTVTHYRCGKCGNGRVYLFIPDAMPQRAWGIRARDLQDVKGEEKHEEESEKSKD